MTTTETLSAMFPSLKDVEHWGNALDQFLPAYEINTPLRVAAFIAQCAHESENFTHLVENLNYSATALLTTWPKHFNTQTANDYARQPEKIANHVYANRMGNGDESTGDGWLFRGKGLIQITGRDNATAFGKHINKTPAETAIYMITFEGAVESACWYWKNNNLNHYADIKDIDGMTRVINGGLNGLNNRIALYTETCKVMGVA